MYRKLFLLLVLMAALTLPLSVLAQPTPNDPPDVSPLGTEFRISVSAEEAYYSGVESSASLLGVAMDNNGDAVVLMFNAGNVNAGPTLQARLYDRFGQPKDQQFKVADWGVGDIRFGDVAMDADGDFIAVWAGIYARLFNAAGIPKAAAFELDAANAQTTDEVAVAADDVGNFAVVWTRLNAPSTLSIYVRHFWANGSARGPEIVAAPPVHTYDGYWVGSPDVAMDADGDFVVSWGWYTPDASGITIQRYSAAGVAQGAPITVPACADPKVATDRVGNFVVVCTTWDQSYDGIFARRFLANGLPIGSQFQVNTATDYSQNLPAVAMNASGEMIVTWTWTVSSQPRGVYGRIYDASGAPLGDQFRLNSYEHGYAGSQDVALDNQGDFLTAWHSHEQNGASQGVYGQYNYPTTPNIPILLSLLSNGRVRGLNYMRGDILKYDPAADQWSMFWDASDHGVATANVGDFELLNDNDLLLVFKTPVTLPGAGKVQPHDIARYDAATATYSLYFDGSDVGLTTQGERLDALGMEADGSLLLSTTAGFNVPGLTGVDEDTIRFQPASLGDNTAGSWTSVLWGVNPKDLWALWVDTVSPDPYYYMTFEQPIWVDSGDIRIPNGGILRCRPVYPQGMPFSYSDCLEELYWSAAAAGLSATAKIDGLELLTR